MCELIVAFFLAGFLEVFPPEPCGACVKTKNAWIETRRMRGDKGGIRFECKRLI